MQRKGAHQPECKQNIDSVGFSVSSVVGVVSEIIIVVGACGDVCLCKKRTNEQDDSKIPETGDVELEAGTPQESKKSRKNPAKMVRCRRPKWQKKETHFPETPKTVDTNLTALRTINSDGVLSTEKCQLSLSSLE